MNIYNPDILEPFVLLLSGFFTNHSLKALSIGGGSKRSTTVGEMVNFLSVDAQKIQDLFTFSHLILDVPIQLTATCALMWMTIGWSTSAGLALLLIIVPLNGFIFGNQVRKLQVRASVLRFSI